MSSPAAHIEPIPRPKAQAPQPQLKTVATKVKKKQVYRIRESLPGAFAIEELDMTKDVGVMDVNMQLGGKGKKGKVFRMSGVGVLDLTGD
jgi:hypothetical protein